VALLLALTFAAGAAAGVAADRFGLLPGLAAGGGTDAGRDDRGHRRETTIEKFADHLELTAAQREEIEGILEHYRAAMREMWSEVRPRYRTMVDSIQARIETVLTPEQVVEYRALVEERERRRRERRESGGERPGGR
jgi:Spy/CpxP family protein refolding chaperone